MSERLSANELRRMREALGLSQEEFARVLGVSSSTVSRLERGLTRCSAELSLRAREVQERHLQSRAFRNDAWCVTEFERLRPSLVRFVQRGLFLAIGEDVVAEVSRELVEMLRSRPKEFPESWTDPVEPPEAEARAFRSLVWLVTRRRMYDEIRREYLRARTDVSVGQTAEQASPEAWIDARRFLVSLARRIDALSAAERDLLTAGTEEQIAAMSATDRVRLHRLRRKLATKVKDDL